MGSFHHAVLVDAVCEGLVPALDVPGSWYVDLTAGGGGHARAIGERGAPARIALVDRDPTALRVAAVALSTLPQAVWLVHAPFSSIESLGLRPHAILADLGVSSHQLDTDARGFSFRRPAPLDMRMDTTTGQTAAELIADIEVHTLTRLLREFGEEPLAKKIARAIAERRPTTTTELAELVEAVVPQRGPRRVHPATRTFQALRIAVNDELGELDRLLEVGPDRLAIGGRLAIITFHSLEDRRVKRRFRALSRPPAVPRGLPIPEHERPKVRFRIPPGWKDGRVATETETHENPRARSARVRLLERTA